MRTRVIMVGLLGLALLGGSALLRAGATSDSALRLGLVLVLAFLIVLLVRYVLLLWLGYLHHIESRGVREPDGALPRVTIIVPVYNEAAVISAALRSLLALRYPAFDILVIDDGSTDETFEWARSFEGQFGDTRVRVVHKANGGKASALNTGIALARTPLVLCMDGDSRLTADTLRHAVRHFSDARVGAVAGNVKVVNRNNVWTRLQALEYIEGLNLPRRAQGFMRAVNIIPGPIGVFRRDVLLAVGGYDTDTFAEDADLTLKILTAGWHIVYEDRAVAWTEAPEQYLDLVKQRYRWTRGILQALGKHAAPGSRERQSPVVTLSLFVMLFEAVLWPALNVLGNLLFVVAALSAGITSGVFYWWTLLTLLDVAAALHTVAMEEEDLMLVPYAVIYRFFFIAMIDVAKLVAALEQLGNVRMTWGKLERAGRI
jgi:cellulose synthase/poly-beta-1,6-N-acetylglucosamine synthase-like glycosyltransferase